ncbi:MAG: hypothetical protein APR54_04235 [Candidatus Cloacimonas sp. SDB]|nr:MAG: hypothetical protein APR54_04235 [Candidatus Cloacimonas sp. SDB]
MQKADLIIQNGLIVTVNDQMEIIENGAIAIAGNKIAAIDSTENILKTFETEKMIDATSKIVIPGLINAHSHLPMTYFRGLADDLPLMKWLQEYIWPAEARFLNPEFVYHAALHGAAEMIKGGTTCFNDMYFFSYNIAEAAAEAGLRGIVGEVVMNALPGNKQKENEIFDYVSTSRKSFKRNDLIDFTIAPHAIYTCDKEILLKSLEFARENDMLLHIHVAETEQEVIDSLRNFGKRPVEYLKEIGFLEHKTIFAHGIWINDAELAIIKNKNVSIVVCTESHMKLASGFAPMKQYFENEITVCLGTDGVSSNNNLDMFSEMDFTAKLHKAYNNDPTLLPAEKVLKMATINAARALGKEDQIGSLEAGKLADIITIKTAELANLPMYNVYSHLVYTINSNSVNDVIINGEVVMQSRELVNLNEAELQERARKYAAKIRAK